MFYRKISMMDLIDCHSFTYFDEFIGRDMIFDDSFHFVIHSSRKRICLFNVFEMSSDFFDITDKSHVQHSIYLIQNKIFSDTDINHFLIHKIHQSSRRSDDDSWIFFEDIFLDEWTCSTIKTSKRHSIKFGQISDFFSYLDHKFSGRSKDQCLQSLFICIDLIENRKQKSCGLTSSCLRLSDDIFSAESYLHHLCLDRRHFCISDTFQRSQQSSL